MIEHVELVLALDSVREKERDFSGCFLSAGEKNGRANPRKHHSQEGRPAPNPVLPHASIVPHYYL